MNAWKLVANFTTQEDANRTLTELEIADRVAAARIIRNNGGYELWTIPTTNSKGKVLPHKGAKGDK